MKTHITPLDLASWGGFIMFATSSVITPICLPEISRTFATSFSEGGGMATARTAMMLVVLVLAGISGQKWGKKWFLTGGQYVLAAGLLMTSFAQSYPTLIVALMVTGIGGGIMEALISPLVVDLHPGNSGKYMNITHAFYPVGVMTSSLIFGELLTLGLSWRWMFRLAALGALLVGMVFHGSRFPAAADTQHSAWGMIGHILTLTGFWLFAVAIFLGAGVESALTFWSTSYVATYLEDIPRAGALAVMIFAAAMAAGRFLTARLAHMVSLKVLLLGSALLGTVVSGLLPLVNNLILFYVLVALAGLATACLWPTILAEAEVCLKVDATLLFVLLACAGIAGFGVTPWMMGIIGDAINLRAGFAVIPGLFLVLIVVLVIERRMSRGISGS